MEYQAKLSREGKQWLVEFRDAPGCQTYGASRAAALEAAKEALAGWLEAHLVEGDVPPAPRRRRGAGHVENVEVPMRLALALELRWYRQREGLSVAKAARRAKVSVDWILAIEDPDSSISLSALQDVAEGLGLRLAVHFAA